MNYVNQGHCGPRGTAGVHVLIDLSLSLTMFKQNFEQEKVAAGDLVWKTTLLLLQ